MIFLFSNKYQVHERSSTWIDFVEWFEINTLQPCLYYIMLAYVCAASVVSDSVTLWTAACQASLSMDFPGKNTGVGCHFFLQGIFLTQGSKLSLLSLLHGPVDSLPLSHVESPYYIIQFSSVTQSCPTLCYPINCSMPGLPVHQLLESNQTRVHWVSDAIQPSHPLLSPSPPAINLSQHQGLFKWVSSSQQVAKVLEFQLQHQSFQWTPRTDLLWDGLVGSYWSPRDSQESSPIPQFKSINSSKACISHPYMTTGKTIALTRRTFVGKVMSLLLNMLSRS